MQEVTERFGSGTEQRRRVTERLLRIAEVAKRTGYLQRLVIFGSYVTAKPEPGDVDVILVFDDALELKHCEPQALALLDHDRATREFGASVFWIRPAHLLRGSVDDFVRYWQITREQTRRGIVEVLL
jgi:hypothetical protein